jgi:hypothetical protein
MAARSADVADDGTWTLQRRLSITLAAGPREPRW